MGRDGGGMMVHAERMGMRQGVLVVEQGGKVNGAVRRRWKMLQQRLPLQRLPIAPRVWL